MTTTAQHLAHEAAAAAERGASQVAVEILERAAEFATKHFGHHPAPDDPHWTPRPVTPTPATGIERGLPAEPSDAVTAEDCV